MSPKIEVDDEVYAAMKEHAEPFVDTPNTVLRRFLGLAKSATANGMLSPADGDELIRRSSRGKGAPTRRTTTSATLPRAKRGTILPESEYELPMLQILDEHGGRAPSREVLDELETRLDGLLTQADFDKLRSGDVRWKNRAQFVRLRLVEQGDMRKDSPRGVWEISEQGLRRVSDAK